jgi:hypothetical protein
MTEAAPAFTARAQRFGRRLHGERDPTFAQAIRQAAATRHAEENGESLSHALALLAARPALDGELSGARLAAIAALVGDDLLDAVREADLAGIAPDTFDTVLPPPSALARRGDVLLSKVSASPDLAALAEIAVTLLRSSKAMA